MPARSRGFRNGCVAGSWSEVGRIYCGRHGPGPTACQRRHTDDTQTTRFWHTYVWRCNTSVRHAGGMQILSHHSGERDGPGRCAVCGGPLGQDVAPFFLTHGVWLALCAQHRSTAFQSADGGRAFADAVGRLWRAACCDGPRRIRSLADHQRRFSAPRPARPRGSYTWPALRRELEERFAAGEDPRAVINEARARFVGSAKLPSYRTMRRWFAEARWLHPDWPGAQRRAEPSPIEPESASRQRPQRPSPRLGDREPSTNGRERHRSRPSTLLASLRGQRGASSEHRATPPDRRDRRPQRVRVPPRSPPLAQGGRGRSRDPWRAPAHDVGRTGSDVRQVRSVALDATGCCAAGHRP